MNRDRLDDIVDEHAAAMSWPAQRAEGYSNARGFGVALVALVAAVLLVVAAVVLR